MQVFGLPRHVTRGAALKRWRRARDDGLTAADAAAAVGVSPARINEIVRDRRGVTAESALRLARYFNTDARSWMNLQDRYELEIAARDKAAALRAIRPREAA